MTRAEIQNRKIELSEKFPIGSRIKVISLINYEPHLPVGSVGTVVGYDDGCGAGPHILVNWDCGSSLKILYYEGDKIELAE